jgi:hypothetical protein
LPSELRVFTAQLERLAVFPPRFFRGVLGLRAALPLRLGPCIDGTIDMGAWQSQDSRVFANGLEPDDSIPLGP